MRILKVVDSLNIKLSDENKYVVVDSSFESEEDEYNIVVRHVWYDLCIWQYDYKLKESIQWKLHN